MREPVETLMVSIRAIAIVIRRQAETMSTVERRQTTTLPPLVDGQILDQATFHERYAAMPDGTWAELVGGVVHMPSPLRNEHGEYDDQVAFPDSKTG